MLVAIANIVIPATINTVVEGVVLFIKNGPFRFRTVTAAAVQRLGSGAERGTLVLASSGVVNADVVAKVRDVARGSSVQATTVLGVVVIVVVGNNTTGFFVRVFV